MATDKETNLLNSVAELRSHAQKQLQTKTAEKQLPRSKEASQRLVNELEIYQIEMEQQNTELRRAQEELENQQVELEMQNEELQRIQGDLELSRNKYSELYDFAPVGYFTFDAAGVIQNVNLTGAQMLGIERRGLVDRSFSCFITDAAAREIFAKHLATVLLGSEMQRCEIKLTGKKGTAIYGQLQSVTVDDGTRKEVHVLSSIVDGTRARQLGAEIQDAREYAENIVETVRKPLVVLDFDLKILTANHSFYETFKSTPEETIGHFIYDLGNRQWDIPKLRILFENILPHDTVINDYEVDHEFPGIGRKIILLNARQIFRKNIGSHIILLAMEDITARTLAEEALLKAGALQSAIFNSANFSSIATDAKGVIQIFNVGAERMLGYTAAEVMNRITPADISDPQEVIARAKALSVELDTPITPGFEALVFKASRGIEDIYELTYIRKDGSRFPAVVSVTALRDEQDAIIGYLLIGTDNTARKQTSQYARSLIEASLDPLVTISADGKITDVNEGSIKVTGVPRQKLVGTDFSDYFTEPERAREGYREAFSKGAVTDYPLTIRHKDGRLTDVLYNASVYKDVQGNVLGVFAAARDITARKQAEEALLQAGALQSAIFNSANFSSIATDAKGVIQIFNVGAERMLGYTAAEVMNQITPADISDPQEVIARAAALSLELDTEITPGFDALVFKASRGIEDIYELTYIRKDGSCFPAVVSVTALRDEQEAIIGYLLIGTDNTARKQAEEALLQAGALQSAIFNSANFSSIATDAKGVIQIFNVGAERMLGYTAAEVMNQITPADISDPQEVIARASALSIELDTAITPGFDALVFKARRGIEDIYELTYIRKDGSRFPAVVSVTALRDAQETIIGYLLIGTDNTARKQVEAERARLDQVLLDKNAELESARSIAEKANQAKSDFLSSMSHELRTPLGAILGFAQLLESGTPPPTPAQKRSIDQILKAGWYLLELINEILDLALIESGKLSLSLEPVSLQEVMQECAVMVELQAHQCDINVTFAPLATPYFVNADLTRVKQLLINLLSNAIKYNSAGGRVDVTCTLSPPDAIRISVRDTGAGLAPEQIAQLFQPFNRLGQEAHGEQGTGIGLVVCKRLVELMDGVIGVESIVGQGSVFWLELKQTTEPQAAAQAAELAKVAQGQTPGSTQLYTLLYVEDNPANLMLVEDILARRSDIQLLSAKEAITGIKMALASRPDVILMDINLPGVSGIEALKILAENPLTAHIPVVALSANAIPSDIEKGLEAGFFRYLTKPIKVNQFMETLDLVLKHAKTKAALAAKKEEI